MLRVSRLARILAPLVCVGTLASGARAADDDAPTSGAVPSGAAGAIVTPPRPAEAAPLPVTPPKLVEFAQAAYPAEAVAAGLTADVVLQLDIDREGRVARAVVVTPAGHGFDEAAVEAASRFRFEPARRGEAPVPARILYRYGFTLRPATAEEAPPPKVTQGLRGVLRASDGEIALAGAVVRLRDAARREVSVTTGADGAWNAGDLAPGRYHVTASAPGFTTIESDEEVAAGAETEVVYRLAPAGVLEVTIQGQRPPREVTRRTLEQREIARIPGTNGDALKSLQNLPGVARPPGIAGLLIVRGSAPNDTQTFIDGTYVPLVYHFGGLSSVLPTEMLEKIDFYPGNFSAQYGRLMGGIVDVGVRSANPDKKYHALAQVDLIDARLMAEGPVPGLPSWSFMVGARRSWIDVWLKPVLTSAGAGVTTAPVYYDWQAFAETKPNTHSSLRVGFFGSDDRLDILIKDPAEQDPTLGGNIGLHTGFWRAQILYRNEISDAVRYRGVLSYGVDKLDFGIGSLYFKLTNTVMLHRSELSTRLAPGVTLHSGVDLAFAPYDIDLRLPPPPKPGEPNPGPFAARPPRLLSTSDHVWRPGGYIEAELTPGERTKIVPGLRADYARDIGRWDLSPRVNARHDVAHDFPRTTVKGGVGLYHQPPAFQESSPVFGSPGLISNRAIHYSLGVEQDFTRHIEASVEGFYKDLQRLVSRTPSASGGYDYGNDGTGYVVGSELLLKYKPDARFFGWLAYTLSRSVRRDPPDLTTRLYQYDQTHILTVLGSYKLGHGWEFGARFRLVSGSLYTPSIGGIYNADAGAYGTIDGTQFSQRLALFHQLDLRVDKEWRFENWRLRAYLDVQNVYNHSNAEGVSYNYNFTRQTTVSGLPIIPSLGIRGEI